MCTFTSNVALAPEVEGTKCGGSAMFLSVRKGRIKQNNFYDTEGTGSIVKLYNKFDEDQFSLKLLNKNEGLIISGCKFEINNQNSCCIYYLTGNTGTNVELIDSSFTGFLTKGFHYIEGKSLSNNSPKMIVKKCRFSNTLSNALNKDYSMSYLQIDFKDQVFDADGLRESKKSLESWKISLVIAVPAVVVATIIIGLIIFFVKRRNPNIFEENEMSIEVRDDLNESLIK